ncbi:glycosyltransferase family 39 protein [Maridesulfovibrio sp.]|uniref:glycosyltransferase family 39 protein n=1 Tax=Maridesulfovibrio sp. TaxID=2795000 RepID=UPI002A188375|nr:glycosyltransferase family 39 protein [Maridesulfovibrio sp.]
MSDSYQNKNTFFSGHPDALYICAVVLFTVLVRIATLEYIEIGGDSLCVWENVVNLVNSGHYFEWTHHTMRWAINMPLYLVLRIFGTSSLDYYILPMLFSALASVLAYFAGREMGGRRFGVLTSVLLTLYPKMTTMGSQLWPGIYEMTYLLGCILCLLVWRRKGCWWLLALGGVLAGFAWGSRLTSIYYGPGVLALLLAGKRDVRPVLIFSAFFAMVLGLEWYYFYADTGNGLGRLGIITGTHVAQDELLVSVGKYFLNFTRLIKLRGLLPVVLAAAGVSVWLLRKGSENEKCIAVLFLGGLFFNVYMISSISPLKLAAPVGSRYLTAGVPYMIIVLLAGLARWQNHSGKVAYIFRWGLIIAFALFTIKDIPAQNTLIRLGKDLDVADVVRRENLPVLMRYNAWTPNGVEKIALDLVGVERSGRLKINEDEKMLKNGRRMRIMLFGLPTDKSFRPKSIDGYYYIFRGDRSSLSGASRVAVSDFSRKGHELLLVPAQSLPIEILRGDNK